MSEAPRRDRSKRQETTPKAPARVDSLPAFRVMLHADQTSSMDHVVETLLDLTPLSTEKAVHVMLRTQSAGVALVLETHRERAELYVDQFQARGLHASMEPVA